MLDIINYKLFSVLYTSLDIINRNSIIVIHIPISSFPVDNVSAYILDIFEIIAETTKIYRFITVLFG